VTCPPSTPPSAPSASEQRERVDQATAALAQLQALATTIESDAQLTASAAAAIALRNATEALRCDWVRRAHAKIQASICDGVVSSYATMFSLLVLGASLFLLESCHAASLAGVHWTSAKQAKQKAPPKPRKLPTPQQGPTAAELEKARQVARQLAAITAAKQDDVARKAKTDVKEAGGLMHDLVGEMDDSDEEPGDSGALANGLLMSAVFCGRDGASPQRPIKTVNGRGAVIKSAWDARGTRGAPDIAMQVEALGSTKTAQRYDREPEV